MSPAMAQNSDLQAKGVSLSLAKHRKETIKELKYTLFFSIPAHRSEPVAGKISIHFNVEKSEEVLLDFREESDKIQKVSANGRPTSYVCRDEHLILPASVIKAGRNVLDIQFTAGDQSLNRNEEFLYTLLVPDRARTVFPCFDQPDLKATFTLQLELPQTWKAVSNTYQVKEEPSGQERKTIYFAPTEPLSTYLFSFVVGRLEHREYGEGQRKIAAYYRETDTKKVAQLDTIFKQVTASLRWMEEYTGVTYPFAKYDFIILPGFQYGGMEHTGATLYNDNQMFLSEHPTPDEELRRTQLIAHETAHMWFGDFVTMAWFNDVWTKEVFANYFSACITEPLFPKVNHTLNRLRTFTTASLSEDRTLGTTAIRQPLDNLNQAGLIYGQIIYNKAPVMMMKLVELMGKENFRQGIQTYLKTYAYGNATWDELVACLNRYSSVDLKAFSDVWVNQKGMPEISFQLNENELIVHQSDPYQRGLVWPQRFNVELCGERDSTIEVNLNQPEVRIALPFQVDCFIPNSDGRGYGLFMPDQEICLELADSWQKITDETTRQAVLMLLYENYLANRIDHRVFLKMLYKGLILEENPLIASSLPGLLAEPIRQLSLEERIKAENELMDMAENHPTPAVQIQLLRLLMGTHSSEVVTDRLYAHWQSQTLKRLNQQDYVRLAYELALRRPNQGSDILSVQRGRITDPDRLRQFDFIAQGITASPAQQRALFDALLQPENRRIEPWTATLLSYLNHPLRQAQAVSYIRPGLEVLQEVQRTGDIFFPRNWVSALLGHHHSLEAYREVKGFLEAHPDYPPLLKNKILQAAYLLYREFEKSPVKE